MSGRFRVDGVVATEDHEKLTGLPRLWILSVTFRFFLVLIFPIPVSAQGAPPESAAQQTLNPLAHSNQLKVTPSVDFSAGPHLDALMLEFQPRVPIGLTEHWRVINRSNLSITRVLGNEETTRLSDFDTSFFLSPAGATKWVWGAGPIIKLPTATDMTEGTGKWSTGPTAALVYVNGPWVNGVVASHLWSVAGRSSRERVELTQIEMQISYAFSNSWYVETNPTISTIGEPPPGKTGSSRLVRSSDGSSRSAHRVSACKSARTTMENGRTEPPRGCSSQGSRGSIDRVNTR